ncbi:MAG: WD40 repeat domain-containing protein [Thermoplasmata archaeon]
MRRVLRVSVALSTIALLLMPVVLIPEHSRAQGLETLSLMWERLDGHNATMWSVRWSPDNSMISSTFFDNTTVVWNSTTGRRIVKLGSHENYSAETRTRCDGIKTCEIPYHYPTRVSAWSPDGRFLAVGGDDTLIYIFETTNWTVDRVFSGHEGSVLTLQFSPNGRLLASGSGTDKVDMHNIPENMVKIWDFENGTVIANLTGHKDGVLEVKWSPDASRLVSASDDKTLKVWETGNWTNTMNLTGHAGGVLSVDWSPDGEYLISGSRDYKVRKWNATTGESVVWEAPNCVRSVDWHEERAIIATSGVAEVMVMIRNATNGAVIKTLDENRVIGGAIMSARWSPNGQMLATASGRDFAIRVYAFGLAEEQPAPLIPPWLPGVVFFFAVVGLSTSITIVGTSRILRRRERR